MRKPTLIHIAQERSFQDSHEMTATNSTQDNLQVEDLEDSPHNDQSKQTNSSNITKESEDVKETKTESSEFQSQLHKRHNLEERTQRLKDELQQKEKQEYTFSPDLSLIRSFKTTTSRRTFYEKSMVWEVRPCEILSYFQGTKEIEVTRNARTNEKAIKGNARVHIQTRNQCKYQ